MTANDTAAYPAYPDRNVPNSQKDAEYILRNLMATHGTWASHPTCDYGPGNAALADSWNAYAAPWEMQRLRDFSRGLNTNDALRKAYQLNEAKANDSMTAMKINWAPSMVQWKVMNAVKHFMGARDTEIVAWAIDPLSVDRRTRRRYEKLARISNANSAAMQEADAMMGVQRKTPQDAPQTEEELDIHEAMGPKDEQTLTLTNAVRLMNVRSNYLRIARPRMAEELRDTGMVVVVVEVMPDGIPCERVIPVEDAVIPYSRDGLFNDMAEGGYIVWMTPGEIKARFGGKLTAEQIKVLYDMVKSGDCHDGRSYLGQRRRMKGRVPVFHGYFKDTNDYAISSRKGRNGGTVYKDGEAGGKWSTKQTAYEVVYEGWYVIGSGNFTRNGEIDKPQAISWDCRLCCNMPRTDPTKVEGASLYHTQIPMVVRAYNMTEMRSMSIARLAKTKCIELEELYMQLRNVIRKIIPPGISANIKSLTRVLEDLEIPTITKVTHLVEFGIQTGTFFHSGFDLEAGVDLQGMVDREPPIVPHAGFIGDFERISNQIDKCREWLYETIGLNDATLGNTTDSRQSIGGLKIQAQGSATALGFLFECFDDVEEQVALLKYRMLQCTLRDGVVLTGVPRLFGDPAETWLRFAAEDDPGEVGIEVRAQMTDDDRIELNKSLESAVVNGMINPVDRAMIFRYKNFDQAMRMLDARIRLRERQAHARTMEAANAAQQSGIAQEQMRQQGIQVKIEAEAGMLQGAEQAKTEREIALQDRKDAAQMQREVMKVVQSAQQSQEANSAILEKAMMLIESQERMAREDNATKDRINARDNETREEIADKKPPAAK